MRAIVMDGGASLDRRRADPTPGEGECRVAVRVAGICATDLHLVDGYMNFTGVLGHEFVGTVETGSSRWRGRRVACDINCVCRRCDMCQSGLAHHCRRRTVIGILGRDGCFADAVAVPEANLHDVPDAVTDEQAVFIEPLAAAYQVLHQCRVDARSRVSVLGSGKLAMLVAQVLAATGCTLDVIGRNPATLAVAEKLRIQPFHVSDVGAPKDRDVVVECTGSPDGIALAMKLVRPRGTIVLKTTHAGPGRANLAPIVVDEVTVIGSRCGPFPEAIHALARGAVNVELLTSKVFPLDRGLEALQAARVSGTLKVLLKVAR